MSDIESIAKAQDVQWHLSTAFLILTMQTGFAMLEMGMVSSRYQVNILMKNFMDMAVGAIAFFCVGWAFSYGREANKFISHSEFFLKDTVSYDTFFFQLTFACTSATIVSGAVAGRLKFGIYGIISAVTSAWIYPVAAHWAWHKDGWLKQMDYQDFSGGGPVHIIGGTIGLVMTVLLKPRLGVFTPNGRHLCIRSSPSNVVIGTFILICAWFPFNSGSSFTLAGGMDRIAARAAVNTAVSMGFGTLATLLLSLKINNWHFVNVFDTTTGALCSLVLITPSCGYVEPWAAAVIGIFAAPIALYTGQLMVYLKVDDPVDVVPVHFAGGFFGLFFLGLFAEADEDFHYKAGLFYSGSFHLLGVQMLGALCFFLWAAGNTIIAFFVLNTFFTRVRVSEEDERVGLDATEHNILSMALEMNEIPSDSPEAEAAKTITDLGFNLRHQGEQVFVTKTIVEELADSSVLDSMMRSSSKPNLGSRVNSKVQFNSRMSARTNYGSQDYKPSEVAAKFSAILNAEDSTAVQICAPFENESHRRMSRQLADIHEEPVAVLELTKLPRASAAVVMLAASAQGLEREHRASQQHRASQISTRSATLHDPISSGGNASNFIDMSGGTASLSRGPQDPNAQEGCSIM